MSPESVASRLQSDLDNLTKRLADLIRDLPIKRRNRHGNDFVIIAPNYYWGESSSEQLNSQLAIKRDYEEWFKILQSVFVNATVNLTRRIQMADKQLRQWIELSSELVDF